MAEFLQSYSLSEILIFLVMFAVAFKGVVSFFDWGIERLRKIFKKEQQKEDIHNSLKESIDNTNVQMKDLASNQNEMIKELKDIKLNIQLLTEADQADIKAWITEKHHHFCYEKKYIDDYNLDCIEKRYHYYQLEGGNSFVADLMKEIRALPKQPTE